MVDCEKEEALNLQHEFEWVLDQEIHKGLNQIHQILVECARRFPVALYGHDNSSKQDKFVLSVPVDQLKCIVTLTGDSITHADINFKVMRNNSSAVVKTTIQSEYPWKLQQVQDAANHLQQAIYHIDDVGKNYKFKSSDEVLHILGNILGSLQRGRTSLIVPRKKTMDDLLKSRNMKSLLPNLSEDLAISFYIQSHKLIFAIYQLTNNHGVMKYESTHAECTVQWLNEVLLYFTVGLQLCQQLKDKKTYALHGAIAYIYLRMAQKVETGPIVDWHGSLVPDCQDVFQTGITRILVIDVGDSENQTVLIVK